MEIGQVVFILSNKEQKTVPALVTKKIVTETIDGDETIYVLGVGPKGKLKEYQHDKIDGTVFSTADDLRNYMFQQMSMFIDQTINDASKQAHEWYPAKAVQHQTTLSDPTSLIDELTPANTPQKPLSIQDIKANQREKLKKAILAGSDDPSQQQQDNNE